MFSKLFVPVLLALSVAAAPQTTIVDQCNTGSVMCCNTVQDASNPVIGNLLDLLGINAGNLSSSTGQVGLGCTAVGVDGSAEGASCTQAPVCCDGDNFNGFINLGCNSINV